MEIRTDLLAGGGEVDLDAGDNLGGERSLAELVLTIRTVDDLATSGDAFCDEAGTVDLVGLADGWSKSRLPMSSEENMVSEKSNEALFLR